MTPFYSVDAVQKSIEGYVAEINADPSILPSHGPFSKYVLPAEGRQGTIELTWPTQGEDGIACNLTSEGALALNSATEKVKIVQSWSLEPTTTILRLCDARVDTAVVRCCAALRCVGL